MAKTKTSGFFFKMSPEEEVLFERRMAETGIRNKSAFIRKMCIDGHVINLDIPELTEIGRLLRITSNNINQMTRRVNSGGEAYRNDVAEVNEQLTAIRSAFDNAKPGKRFILPPKITDFQDGA